MPFKPGRNRVKITAIELTKLKEKDGDDNRYGVVITGQIQDGSTLDGWMYINGNVGKDEKTGYQRTLDNLIAIGLPDGNLMNLAQLIDKECDFNCDYETVEGDYGEEKKGPLRVQFINPCRIACSENEIAAMMCHFSGGSMPNAAPLSQPSPSQISPPQFQPPVQNTGVQPQVNPPVQEQSI